MRTEKIHTLILGAGPAGLATAKGLAETDNSPILVENGKDAGGLMRSIKRGKFSVDIGRKELYSRIPEVNVLWSEILGDEYRPYPHRIGILYDKHILETSVSFRGFRYGMPWSMFAACATDYVTSRIKSIASKPRNFEEFQHFKHGRRFSKITEQGYQEKFKGRKWVDMPPQEDVSVPRMNVLQTVKRKLGLSAGEKKSVPNWRHPARGSGQITDLLEQRITQDGARIDYKTKATEIVTSDGRITKVVVDNGSEKIAYEPEHLVSGIPIEFLAQLLLPSDSKGNSENPKSSQSPRNSAVLVYLFLDEPPRFPHAWLHVTCPKTKMGRVTNYTGFNGDMVPKNQTCLCIEYFCKEDDALFGLESEELRDFTMQECVDCGLLDSVKCFDHLTIKLPGVDPSADWQDWLTDSRLSLLEDLKQFRNLYNVSRAGTDVATYAGLKASEAILSGQRSEFDELTDPTRYPPTAHW